MPEQKKAVISVHKALLDVALPTIAALGASTGNFWITGATAIPSIFNSSETLKTFLSQRNYDSLELPVPPWWTAPASSWQMVCSDIEQNLPMIIDGTTTRARQSKDYPSPALVRQIFTEEIVDHLPTWDIDRRDLSLIAGHIVQPLLLKSQNILDDAIQSIRQDKQSELLANFIHLLEEIIMVQTSLPATSSHSGTILIPSTDTWDQSAQSVAVQLEQKRNQGAYDVYICYNEADETEILHIGDQLKAHGLLPWLDIFDLTPGRLKLLQQEEQIEAIQTAAVCVGQHAIISGEALQMYAFIDQFTIRKCAVIPVLLRDAPLKPKLPPLLAQFGWVDFRRQQPDPIKQLIWGITGNRQ